MSAYGSFLNESRQKEASNFSSAWTSQSYQHSSLASSHNPDDIHQAIVDALEDLKDQNQSLDHYNAKLGTKKDTKKLRKKITSHISETKRLAQRVTSLISSLGRDDVRRQRLEQDAAALGEDMQRLIKESAKKRRSNLAVTKQEQKMMKKQRQFYEEPDKLSEDDRQHFLQQQQKQEEYNHLENEIANNEALIREREEEVLDIENSAQDINTIFKELHHMAHDQGDDIKTIEDKVIKTGVSVSKGNENLTKAEKHDKRGRFLICIILLVVLGIALAIVIFFAIAFGVGLL